MPTIRAIVSSLRTSLGDFSRTQEFTDAYLWDMFCQARSVYLNRELEKNKVVSEQEYSSYCFPLQLSNLNQCNGLVPLDCPVKRTVTQISSVVTGRNFSTLNVRNLFGKKLSEVKMSELDTIEYNDIKKNNISWFINNNYVYIYCNNLDIEAVNISAIFENPALLDSTITQCQNIYDITINTTLKTLNISNQLALEKILREFNIPKDNTNDTNNLIKGI
jgi:hypothetical protein